MGLTLWKRNQDRQAAEDHILVCSPAGLAKARPAFCLSPRCKGKPDEN